MHDDPVRGHRRGPHRSRATLDSPFLRRSPLARWTLSALLLPVVVLAVAAAPATGLATLPFGIAFGSLIWWLLGGAPMHPSPAWRRTFYVGAGLVAAELMAAVALVVANRV